MTENTTTQPKWTPGPWEYGVRDDGSLWLSLGDPKTGTHFQADLCASKDDARLIVSARELYEALDDMLWPIMAGCQKPDIVRCMCAKCVEDRARGALAKARGTA